MTQRLNTFISAKPRLITALLVAIIMLPVLAHSYNSSFTRMIADDYCFAVIAKAEGLWGSLVYWFENWSGGHSSILGQSAVALSGPGAAGLLPALLLLSWWASLTWVVYEFWKLCNLRYPTFFAPFLGSLLVYSIVLGLPNIYQAVYWTSGSLTYTAPMVVTTIYAGFALFTIRWQLSGVWLLVALIASGILSFIAGGFSETTVALQIVMLSLAIVAAWFYLPLTKKRAGAAILVAGLIGSLIALVVTIAAPGNRVREATFSAGLPLVRVGFLAIENAAAFIAIQLAFFSLIPILLCLILSAIAAYQLQPVILKKPLTFKSALKWMAIALAVAFILITAALSPAAYGMNKMPASRAWVVPQTILIVTAIIWGFAMGLSLKKRDTGISFSAKAAIALLLLLIVGPLLATLGILSTTSSLQTYASEWDARDQSIRSAVANGDTTAIILPYSVDLAKFATLDVVDETATGDYTVCMQNYYGLQSVTILEEAEGST